MGRYIRVEKITDKLGKSKYGEDRRRDRKRKREYMHKEGIKLDKQKKIYSKSVQVIRRSPLMYKTL